MAAPSILAMHRTMEEKERLIEDAYETALREPDSGDPDEKVLLWNVYRKARRRTRKDGGLVYLRTADYSIRQARGLAEQGLVLRYYPTSAGVRPAGFEAV
jgi:ketosteroid isomerase-like protein